jgi:Flavin containing amine oxidoreductase
MAFTYIPPSVDGFTELRTMGEPVYDHTGTRPCLMFAGEHTSPFHPSTIHGAFLSGIREAYRLDLALYPEANEELTFSDSELYQRTFQVKRRYFGQNSVPFQVRSNSDPPVVPANRRQHRQRGAACVMKLRKRPDTLRSTSQSPDALDAIPARRSPRAIVPNQQKVNPTNEPVNGVATEASSDANPQNSIRDLTVLEDATLVRGIESYGNNYEYLLEKLVPVYGSDNNMTLSQLRKRCRHLRSLLRKDRGSSAAPWKRWVAKTVYQSDNVSSVDDAADPEQPSDHASQKKDDEVPVVSVKTRAGRLSKKPDTFSLSSFK